MSRTARAARWRSTCFYEIYDPSTGLPGGDATDVSSSISFFRGSVRAFETSPITVQALTSKNRRAIAFQVQVPKASLPPGLYTCQVSLVDGAARKFTFSRFQLFVRADASAAASGTAAQERSRN